MPTNSENILKPSTLTSSNNTTFDLNQLRAVISDIVREHNREIINHFTPDNTSNKHEFDQTIDDRFAADISDMDKIPDVVRSLREFSGQPGEFGSWKKSVDRILKIYDKTKGTPKYYGILNVIRNKIVGNADTALESYNTPLNWEKIAKCLTMHYADKRDLGTLEYQMTTLVQTNNSIPEFYQQVYHHLSLILNKLSSLEIGQESMNIMTQSYRDKALDTFVRGLKGDLPRLLSMRGPADLPEALHLCLKLENVQYRIQHSHGNIGNGNSQVLSTPFVPARRAPPIPPRNTFTHQRRNFYPELLHNPQSPQNFSKPFQYNHPQNFNKFGPTYVNQPFQSPINRNQFNRPEPMDIDQSIQSRRVNYQNRPVMNQGNFKRPYSNQIHQPAKLQRINHTEPSHEPHDFQEYYDGMNAYDAEYDQTFVEYTNSQIIPQISYEDNPANTPEEHDDIEQLDDVHFLD